MGHSEPAESHVEKGQKVLMRWTHDTSLELSSTAREVLWVLFQSLLETLLLPWKGLWSVGPPHPTECHGAVQWATDQSAWWWGEGCCPRGCPSSRLLRACFCREPGGKAPRSRPGRRPSAPRWSAPASWTLSAEKITREGDQIRSLANKQALMFLCRLFTSRVTESPLMGKTQPCRLGDRGWRGKRKLQWKSPQLHEGPFIYVIFLRNPVGGVGILHFIFVLSDMWED